MKKPVIELKKISVNAALSEETNAFTADLYVDGEKFATLANRGHGGCDEVRPVPGKTWEDIKALEARIEATFDPIENPYGAPFDPSLELVTGEIIDAYIVEKAANRVCSRKVAFFKEPPADGARAPLYTIAAKTRSGAPVPIEAAIANVRNQYPTALILNELVGAARVAAYRKAA